MANVKIFEIKICKDYDILGDQVKYLSSGADTRGRAMEAETLPLIGTECILKMY